MHHSCLNGHASHRTLQCSAEKIDETLQLWWKASMQTKRISSLWGHAHLDISYCEIPSDSSQLFSNYKRNNIPTNSVISFDFSFSTKSSLRVCRQSYFQTFIHIPQMRFIWNSASFTRNITLERKNNAFFGTVCCFYFLLATRRRHDAFGLNDFSVEQQWCLTGAAFQHDVI